MAGQYPYPSRRYVLDLPAGLPESPERGEAWTVAHDLACVVNEIWLTANWEACWLPRDDSMTLATRISIWEHFCDLGHSLAQLAEAEVAADRALQAAEDAHEQPGPGTCGAYRGPGM